MKKNAVLLLSLVCAFVLSSCTIKKEDTSSLSSIKDTSSFVLSSEISSATSVSSTPPVSSAIPDNSPIVENNSAGIPDKVLYQSVLTALGKKADEKFTQNEALTITFLSYGQEFYKEKIITIDGIWFLKNVNFLALSNNEIVDPSPVLALKKLKNLNLSYNKIEDVSSLSKLNGVEILNLAYNKIKDISPLSSANGLKELDLWYNSIADVSSLLALTSLNLLNLESNLLNMEQEKTVGAVNSLKTKVKYFSLGVQGVQKGETRKTPYTLYIGKQQTLNANQNTYYTKATLNGAEIELDKLYTLTEPKNYQLMLWDNKQTRYGIAFVLEKTN